MAHGLTSGILHSPAIDVWRDLDLAGIQLKLSAGGALLVGPPGRVTPAHVAMVRAHKGALRLLLGLCDDGVEQRRDAFARQYGQAPQVPLLLWRADVPYVSGVCFSCGDLSGRPTFGLCWRCLLARRLALGQAVDVELFDLYAEARLVA